MNNYKPIKIIEMIKVKSILSLMVLSALFFTACYNSGGEYYDELDVTLTQYDVDYVSTEYTTFAVPDSAVLRTNDKDFDEDAFYAPNGSSDKALSALATNFSALGYNETDIETADFVAVPTVLVIRNSGAIYYPPGWWWGYPGYGWGYPGYPGYPWYPGYVTYYSYTTGTIILEMVDGDSYREALAAGENDVVELEIRWQATIDGYLSSNDEYNAERAQRGFEEAFEQSPYLKK